MCWRSLYWISWKKKKEQTQWQWENKLKENPEDWKRRLERATQAITKNNVKNTSKKAISDKEKVNVE